MSPEGYQKVTCLFMDGRVSVESYWELRTSSSDLESDLETDQGQLFILSLSTLFLRIPKQLNQLIMSRFGSALCFGKFVVCSLFDCG